MVAMSEEEISEEERYEFWDKYSAACRATKEFLGLLPRHEGWFKEKTPFHPFLPVLYDDHFDIKEFRKFRVGHEMVPSKNPRKRSNPKEDAFARYALNLYQRIISYQSRYNPLEIVFREDSENYFQFENRDHAQEIVGYYDLVRERRKTKRYTNRLRKTTPEWVYTIGQLPYFDAECAEVWRKNCQELFQHTFPKSDLIDELAGLISYPYNQSAAQIQARIIDRIGRAVLSMARKR